MLGFLWKFVSNIGWAWIFLAMTWLIGYFIIKIIYTRTTK